MTDLPHGAAPNWREQNADVERRLDERFGPDVTITYSREPDWTIDYDKAVASTLAFAEVRRNASAFVTAETEVRIKPGTIVKLKSGGPRMTVGYLYTDPDNAHIGPVAGCAWFDVAEVRANEIPVAALRVVPDGEVA